MKRILALFLALTLIFSLTVYTPAFATEDSKGENTEEPEEEDQGDKRPDPDYNYDDAAPPSGIQTGDPDEKALAVWEKFKDVKGHWAESTLKWAVLNGLMCGRTSEKIDPDGNITRAEMVTMIVRAFGAYKKANIDMYIDVKDDMWCYENFQRIVKMDCFNGYGNSVQPNENVTRQEVAVLLVRAGGYLLEDSTYLYKFSDYKACDYQAAQYLATAIAQGLIKGFPDGTCRPQGKITRAEFAVMLSRMAYAQMNGSTVFTERNINGSLMVGAGALTIRDMYITKDVFLTDGVGDESFTIDNTHVGDTMYVRGTGPNTVYVDEGSDINNLVFCNPNNAVRLVVKPGATVNNVYITNANTSVTLTGTVGNVYVMTSDAPVKLSNAVCGSVVIDAKLAALSADINTEIQNLTLTQTAKASRLEVNGRLGELFVDAQDSVVSINGFLQALTIGPNADNLKFGLKDTASLKMVDVVVDNLTLSLSGKMSTVRVIGEGNTLKFTDKTQAESVVMQGDDNTISFGANAKIKAASLVGEYCTLSLGAGSEVGTIEIKGDDSKLTLGEKVEVSSIKVNGDDSKVTVGKNSECDELYIAGDDINATLYGEYKAVTLSGNDVKATIDGEADSVNLMGSDLEVKFAGEIDTVTVRASKVKLSGSGVGTIHLNQGFNINVAVGGAFLVNMGATSVYVGKELIVPGTTVQLNEKGTGLVVEEDDGDDDEDEDGDGEDEDGEDEDGDGEDEEPIKMGFTLKLASAATASELDPSGNLEYSSFVGTMLYDDAMGDTATLTGTVNYVENFYWYSGEKATGYYVPMYIESVITLDGATLTIGDVSFGTEIRSSGSAYYGNWMVPVYLDPFATTKTVAVTYDADGDADAFAPHTVYIDYSRVTFVGGPAGDAVYALAEALPGVDGAETASLVISASEDKTIYTYTLATENLLETRNAGGRYGYWTGIRMGLPGGAAEGKLVVTPPVGDPYNVALRAVNGVVEWAVNAEDCTDTAKEFVAAITWYDGQGNVVDTTCKTIVLNLAGVKLAGQGEDAEDPGEGEPEEEVPVVDNMVISAVTPEECEDEFDSQLTQFAIGYGISDQTIVGTFVGFVSDTGAVRYYIPVKITGNAAEPCTLMYEGRTMALVEAAGEFTKFILIPAEVRGLSVADFKVMAVSADLESSKVDVSITMDCTNTGITNSAMILLDEVPSGTINGKDVSAYITMPEYSVFYNMLEVTGSVAKHSSYDYYGNTLTSAWLIPIKALIRTDATDWRLDVKGSDGVVYGSFTSADVVDGVLTLVVPVGVDTVTFDSITLVMYAPSTSGDGTLEIVCSSTVYSSATLIGMSAPSTP